MISRLLGMLIFHLLQLLIIPVQLVGNISQPSYLHCVEMLAANLFKFSVENRLSPHMNHKESYLMEFKMQAAHKIHQGVCQQTHQQQKLALMLL